MNIIYLPSKFIRNNKKEIKKHLQGFSDTSHYFSDFFLMSSFSFLIFLKKTTI